MKTYQKVYNYPDSGGTEITINIIFNTGTQRQVDGSTISTSSIEISFTDHYDRTDDIPNQDLEQREAQIQKNAEAYIDGLTNPALEGYFTDNGFVTLTMTLSAPANLMVTPGTTNSISAVWDIVSNANNYAAQLSESISFDKGYEQLITGDTEIQFTDLKYSTLYYVRVAALPNGAYGESDYSLGSTTTIDAP